MKLHQDLTNLFGRLPHKDVSETLNLFSSLRPPPLRTGETSGSSGGLLFERPELSGEPQEAPVSTKRRLRGGGAPRSGADPDSGSWEQRMVFRTTSVRPCARTKE